MKKHIIVTILLNISCLSTVIAQNKPLELSLGSVKTELKQNAIDIGIRYIKSLDSLFKVQDILLAGRNNLFQATPEFNIQYGSNDAFSSIDVKLKGLLMFFKTVEVDNVKTPCSGCPMHLLPISFGFESNSRFNSINGIVEFGYVPWYQSPLMHNIPSWVKRTKLGLFIQAGYKFNIDSTGTFAIGGQIDESKELLNSEILRTKGSFAIDTESLFEIEGVGFGLVGRSDVWYDFLNSEIYYSISGNLRLYLSQTKDRYFDFKYQKGSGAPNFNQGDQYGIALTVAF